ncbi:MAG TPA: hypothetical protein VL994_07455, partial [Steroidobacteraceae bacterium]|nr:hypothetical protein [Steroidobacteraceae bacterium]
DYARALRVAIEPPPLGLVTLSRAGANALRGLKARREFIARVRARAAVAAGSVSKSAGKATK